MSQPDEKQAQELARARQQWEDLARAHQWASDLMDDENQDRVLILEGLLELRVSDDPAHTFQYCLGLDQVLRADIDKINNGRRTFALDHH